MPEVTLHLGDCLEILPTIPDASIDACITDPPYPMIKRDYGMLTETQWWDLMMGVCREVRRVLKPTGSAVFILQPNSRKVGSMRGWLWEFMAWVCREWNMVQDVWWWNVTALPLSVAIQGKFPRSSIKACVWCGDEQCYHDQSAVMLSESESNISNRTTARFYRSIRQSIGTINDGTARAAAIINGGVTPFNLLPIPNGGGANRSNGHGAGTPLKLAKWWTRYICPPGGMVIDPFVGSGTMMLAAMEYGCNGIGIDKEARYIEVAQRRVNEKQPALEMESCRQS